MLKLVGRYSLLKMITLHNNINNSLFTQWESPQHHKLKYGEKLNEEEYVFN